MKVFLKVTRGPHKGRSFEFAQHDMFLVGRSVRSHFRLSIKDGYFSRFHFMVEVNPPVCRLVDMGSTNGTFVNDTAVKTTFLKHNDVIRGGRTNIRVHIEGLNGQQTKLVDAPATKASPSLEVNKHSFPNIDGYTIIRELGRGGMGVVHLAIREEDGKKVAIKTIKPDGPCEPSDINMFLHEAGVMKELDHSNIVKFLDLGESDNTLFVVLEYVPGDNIAALIKKNGPLSITQATRVIRQLLTALQYAHSKGIVHRDIKPENILLKQSSSGKNSIKLADFGLARAYHSTAMSGLTFFGEARGSLAYLPPELITNYRHVDPLNDIYSTGATLYTLLTDKFVYDFPETLQQSVLMVLQDDPVPILDRKPNVPRPLADLIHTALSRDPQNRFKDVTAMLKALQPFTKTKSQ